MTTIQIQLKGSNLLMGWQRLKISLRVSDTLFSALLSFVLCDRYGDWPTKISARSDCFLRSYFECIWCVLSTGCSPHTNPSKTKTTRSGPAGALEAPKSFERCPKCTQSFQNAYPWILWHLDFGGIPPLWPPRSPPQRRGTRFPQI